MSQLSSIAEELVQTADDKQPILTCYILAKMRFENCVNMFNYLGRPSRKTEAKCSELSKEMFFTCIEESTKKKDAHALRS